MFFRDCEVGFHKIMNHDATAWADSSLDPNTLTSGFIAAIFRYCINYGSNFVTYKPCIIIMLDADGQ